MPWKVHPKSDLDRLQDMMAQAANLIEGATRLNTITVSDVAQTQTRKTIQQCQELRTQLGNWYLELLRKQPGPLVDERPSSARFLSRFASIFPNSFYFQNFEIARLHLSYWTTLLLLCGNMFTLSFSSLGEAHQTSSWVASLRREFADGELLDLARKITQSMEYLLSEEMHILGPQTVFFALRLAIHVFTNTGEAEEIERCEEILEELDRRGYPFGKILRRCEWDDIPALLSGKSISTNGALFPNVRTHT